MGRWQRILKHRWFDETDARKALGGGVMARITERIATSERCHSGEIRVVVEGGLPLSYLWRRASSRDRAVSLFGKLRVWDTELNNGVLIYLLLAERAIEIVADRGIARHVPHAHWQAIIAGMRDPLRSGQIEKALIDAIEAVDAVLQQHAARHPAGTADKNELPDRPLTL